MAIGVYCIRNKITGKFYIGSTIISFRSRWGVHKTNLRKRKHPNRYLQSSWNKYGEAAFEFFVVEECNKEVCIGREQWWINHTGCFGGGYNLSPTAQSVLGLKKTEEQRNRHTIANKKKAQNKELEEVRIKNLREVMETDEWKKKNAEAVKATVARNPVLWSETSRKNALEQHRDPIKSAKHRRACALAKMQPGYQTAVAIGHLKRKLLRMKKCTG